MKYPEDDLQMSVAKILDSKKLLWCHVANERKTSKQQGLRLKKKGVKRGVPDVLIFEPKGIYYGLAIELKIKPNKPTNNQLEWLQSLSDRNWKSYCAYNIDEVIEIVEKYINQA